MKVYNLGLNLWGKQSYKINKATSTKFQDIFDVLLIISFFAGYRIISFFAGYRSLVEQ